MTIETGVRRHFSRAEWEAISGSNWWVVAKCSNVPLEAIENPSQWKNVNCANVALYASRLALFQRIKLPLAYTISTPHLHANYLVAHHPNAEKLRELLQSHYASVVREEMSGERKKEQELYHLNVIAYRLWLAGYGLHVNGDCAPVTDDVLQEAESFSVKCNRRWVCLLGQLLAKDPTSQVRSPNAQVRFAIRAHFTEAEWNSVFGCEWSLVSNYTNFPLEKFEDPSQWPSLPGAHVSTYASRLAFYHRIRLPLSFSLSKTYSARDFPLGKVENFKILSELVETFFPVFFKMDAKNATLKNEFLHRMNNLTLSFWLAGYGLRSSHNYSGIDPTVFKESLQLVTRPRRYSIHRLGVLLEHDQKCPNRFVEKSPRCQKAMELEDSLWQRKLLANAQAPCYRLLRQYVFGELLARVQGPQVRESIFDGSKHEVAPMREGLSALAMQTWTHYSCGLREFAEWCETRQYESLDQCLIPGIAEFLREGRPSHMRNLRMSVRAALREWVRWYSAISGKSFPENKAIPRVVRRSTIPHGKLLDLASAELFIDTLLDEQSPSFSENNLLDFRCRRAMLIALATGGRGKSIRLLFRDCLKQDQYGHHFLHFHSVKTKPSHDVEVGPDVVRWVEELQRMAPSEKLHIPQDTMDFGDGLTEYRLFANAKDNGPLSVGAINAFLNKVQRHLWPARHPNGRPFTCHDARRLQAIFLLLQENKLEEIRQRLGQTNVKSVAPYVATKPPQYQRWFGEILRQGIWKSVSDKEGDNDGLPLDQVVSQASRMTNVSTTQDFVRQLVEKTVQQQHNPYELQNGRILPVNIVSSGFPRRTHHCTAHELLNCGHTELHCFSCDKYNPDTTMLEDHKAEVFRYMVLALRSSIAKKRRRDVMAQQSLELREESVTDLLDQAIPKLFGARFGLAAVTITQLKDELWANAKFFVKQHGLEQPAPSFQEALQFMRERQESV